MEKYPWCDGVDIDLEKGDDYSTAAKSTTMFRNIYNTVKSYNPAKHILVLPMNVHTMICFPFSVSMQSLLKIGRKKAPVSRRFSYIPSSGERRHEQHLQGAAGKYGRGAG